jgi:hypothetical protein
MRLEQVGALVGVTERFHGAKFRGLFGEGDGLDAFGFEGFEDFTATRLAQMRRKEAPVTDDNSESRHVNMI